MPPIPISAIFGMIANGNSSRPQFDHRRNHAFRERADAPEQRTLLIVQHASDPVEVAIDGGRCVTWFLRQLCLRVRHGLLPGMNGEAWPALSRLRQDGSRLAPEPLSSSLFGSVCVRPTCFG